MAQTEAIAAGIPAGPAASRSGAEVALWRLYVLRFFFAVLAVGQGMIQLPLFFHHPHWTVTSAAAHSFLLALALLSLVGIRYPLQMLPLLIYEIAWKLIWLAGFALPLWLANQFDAQTRQSFFEIAPIVIIIPFMPWGYVFEKYVRQPGDRWR
ncbi:MAG: hypothetical protein JO208_00035 [Alphaproteobacteria bacterium]|nr:hypothetical protein [Alphaproteobacteria bacterium]